MFDQEHMSVDERKDELWKTFEDQPRVMHVMSRDFNQWSWNLEDDYNPKF